MKKVLILAALTCAALASACSKKASTRVEAPTPGGGTGDRATARDDQRGTATVTAGDSAHAARVYFEFDSSELSPAAKDELRTFGDALVRGGTARVTIEGHCDERGTPEYNIALGERRAQVIREYLVRLGVDGGRLSIISFGEERPASAGDGEQAWARNRRGELVPGR